MRPQYLASTMYAGTALLLLGVSHILTSNTWGFVLLMFALAAAWLSATAGDVHEETGSTFARAVAVGGLCAAVVWAVASFIAVFL